MRKAIGIVAALGLAGLVSGCSNIERQETPEGFVITQHHIGSRYMTFEHNSVLNYDKIFVGDSVNSYTDNGCDGTVDKFCGIECYNRGEQGTEELFAQADKYFADYKQELGVQSKQPSEMDKLHDALSW